MKGAGEGSGQVAISEADAWDARIAALMERLPDRARPAVDWLMEPRRPVVRLICGSLLVVGGVFSFLPILGIWMLPLGLALLAENFPSLKGALERCASWIEQRWAALRGR